MEAAIKQYADSIYEKALFESAQTARRDKTKYLQGRSRAQDSRQLFSGPEYQGLVKIYVDHIDRCTAARLDSYQEAFNEINRSPTEAELNEALNDFKLTWEVQIKHSGQALASFATARNAPAGLNPFSELKAQSAHGHDRVLSDWKIWRGRTMVRTLADHAPSDHKTLAQDHLANSAPAKQSGSANPIPSVFISYSWDDDAHRDWVRTLAERLRADGLNVSIDRWSAVPGDQLPAFMEQAIRNNQFVVIICTPRYKRRADTREGGVGYEGDIMTAEVMTLRNHRKFIPALRNGTKVDAIPMWLSGKYYIDLTGEPYSERNYEDLARTLLGLREAPPPIGKPMSTISTGATHRPLTQESKAEEFDDIKIVRVVVEDVTEPRNDGTPGCALYSIPFQLSAVPPLEWAALFPENWNHPPQFTTMHRPGNASINGATITLCGTTIEEVERYHRNTLQLSVEETNRQYRQRLLAEEQRRARADAHRKQVDEVSKRIKFD